MTSTQNSTKTHYKSGYYKYYGYFDESTIHEVRMDKIWDNKSLNNSDYDIKLYGYTEKDCINDDTTSDKHDI